MNLEDERARLASVYRKYADDARFRGRWDPTNAGNVAMRDERTRAVRELLGSAGRWPLTGSWLLDLGCGTGQALADLLAEGVEPIQMIGLELLEDRALTANRVHPKVQVLRADGRRLPLQDATLGVVLLFTVFSSILDGGIRREVAAEVDRVLAPGGCVLWYDYRFSRPDNRQTVGISKRRVRASFPTYEHDLRTITLLPMLARRLGARTSVLYERLARLRFLRTHLVGSLTKPHRGPARRLT